MKRGKKCIEVQVEKHTPSKYDISLYKKCKTT